MWASFLPIYVIFGEAGGAAFTGSLEVGLLIAFSLGLGDAGLNTSIYSLLQHFFAGRTTHAFAIFRCFQSVLCCVGFAIGPVLDLQYQVLILSGFLLLSVVLAVWLDQRREPAGERRKEDPHDKDALEDDQLLLENNVAALDRAVVDDDDMNGLMSDEQDTSSRRLSDGDAAEAPPTGA